MNYQRLFSADVPSFMRSPVREIFRKVDLSAICSFAGGYPAAVTFPVEDLRNLPGLVLDKYGTKALQYGATQGVPELREAIAKRYGVPVSMVQITTSSQQGIDVCTRILVDPGDVILTTEPTYLGALQSFKAYRADVRPISSVRPPKPGEVCADAPAPKPHYKFIYVIPDFNNPSGETMTLAEREQIVALARELDIIIVEANWLPSAPCTWAASRRSSRRASGWAGSSARNRCWSRFTSASRRWTCARRSSTSTWPRSSSRAARWTRTS